MSKNTIGALVWEAYEAPRDSARRVLAMQLGPSVARQMALLSGIVFAMQIILTPAEALTGAVGVALKIDPISTAFAGPLAAMIGLYLVSGLVWALGGQAGGEGAWSDVLNLVGWWSFVQIPMILLEFTAMMVTVAFGPEIAVLLNVLVFALGLYVFYVLAAFITEVHRFASVGMTLLGVVAVGIGFIFFMSVLLAVLIGPLPQG